MAKKPTKRKQAVKKPKEVVVEKLVSYKPPRMDDKEIAQAFLVAPDDRQRMAWFQMVGDFIEDAMTQAENTSLWQNHGLTAAAIAQQTVMRAFMKEMEERYEKAHDVLSKTSTPDTGRGY